jgi:hypothetical protein
VHVSIDELLRRGMQATLRPELLVRSGTAPAQHPLLSAPTITNAVLSGILVTLILAAARLLWHQRRVPTVLSQRVRRRSYLGAVLAESGNEDVRGLDVLAPRLKPATGPMP